MSPERRAGSVALAVTAALALWHLAVGSLTGLGDAEALYFAYALHPAGGYLDHPPLLGWLLRGATALAGDSAGAVRLVPTALHALTMAGAYLLGREATGRPEAGLGSVLALALLPMATVGGLAAAPDAPATALWVWFGVALGRSLRRHRSLPSGLRGRELLGRAAGLGALLGATFLAKHTGLLLVPAALAAVAHPRHRGLLRGPGPYVAAAACLAVASPVVLWNADNGWVGVLHRLVWTQAGGPSLANAAAAVGGQLLYVGPPMLLACGVALRRLVRARREPEAALLLGLSAPALAFTFLLALLSPAAEPHWTAQGIVTLSIAAGAMAPELWPSPRIRAIAWSAAALLGLFLAVLHLAVFTPLLPRLAGPSRYDPRVDLTVELRGWPEVARAVLEARGEDEPVAASHYTVCAQLVHALALEAGRGRVRVLCLSDEVDDFDLWGDGGAGGERSVLYVEDGRFGRPAAEALPGRRLEPVGAVQLERGGLPARSFRLVRAARR